ncbi:carbamoyltransferase HypF [Rhodococcus opacus]|uniref:carbamoyltransferase HypF n=1 Tax=Rhodococcus opacus TaxID=37919 RepID=UPI0007CD550C|nr:carbamoyltransferase HypF [Rhodococcus opacus]MDX5962574.1 carbamoyltransferase HypF [Rhodococcus opacus]CAG7641269.1 Carbamoyltransferase HypF [Rhodococcus opacus]
MTSRVLSQTNADETGIRERRRLVITGVVQGVGFRPFVARLAAELQLAGHCGNDEVGVFVEAEGSTGALDEFTGRLRAEAPPLSLVVDIATETLDVQDDASFTIIDSRSLPGLRTLVPPDVATCVDCLGEMIDPGDRRYRHPFVTCTNCGPRFTIIKDLPYDRPATTMAAFPMCEQCATEYDDPSNRRYHAQPISCHDCGPRVWVEVGERRVAEGNDAFAAAQQALADGRIVAVKGIGGFHLACDATNPAAVARLRKRKRRPGKPFAVMAPDLVAARNLVVVSDVEGNALSQPSRPIVLLRKRQGSGLADSVAPDIDEIGIILPYTPVHHLLFSRTPGSAVEPPRLLVMTSGNVSDEPLCFSNEDARSRMADVADVFLMHDRQIAVPCEDSVVTLFDGAEFPIRRSRGFAPLPVILFGEGPDTLAVGAEVKNTFCLTRQGYAFCSAHLGDMGSLQSQRVFTTSVAQLSTLHGVRPALIVADDHPGYGTRRWAERYSDETGVPLLTVQHHHAHVASLLAEHRLVGTPVIGVVFDGTGYGCDHTVWGGEVLSIGSDICSADRVGHLQPFLLPGGDAAVRNPVRVALALLHVAESDDLSGLGLEKECPVEELAVVRSQIANGFACVETTSVGRLFDGVASLLGVRHRVSYEAQAAVELEALARTATAPVDLRMDVCDGELLLAPLIRGLVAGIRSGEPASGLALGFHQALGDATARLVAGLAAREGVDTVGLTGGVFQNRLLTAQLCQALSDAGLRVLTHHLVPPNDGGLSLGQAVIGRAWASMHHERRGD